MVPRRVQRLPVWVPNHDPGDEDGPAPAMAPAR